jgi:hypothetical protein
VEGERSLEMGSRNRLDDDDVGPKDKDIFLLITYPAVAMGDKEVFYTAHSAETSVV